jgi:DNA polymerase III delta prime subunit
MIKDILFWEKFRPNQINKMILLPRIKKFLGDGIQTNILLHGYMGTGKSTLIRILLKDKVYKHINASLQNGVDLLREELYDFCVSRSSPFIKTDDKFKYIYLEEFDKSTPAFQDAFKAFIEEFDSKVRFIITMNHIENVIPEIKSRFNIVNFTPQSTDEKTFLKNGYFKYLKSICLYLDFDLDNDIIRKIINKNFPDLRSSVQIIQEIYITGDTEIYKNINNNDFVYKYILNNENDPIKNYNFVDNNFSDNPVELLKTLSRPFIEFLIEHKKEIFEKKGFLLIKLSKEHNETYNNQMVDPIIHLSNYLNELKKIIN